MSRVAIDVDDTLYSFTQLARAKFVDFAIERGDDRLMRGAYCAWVEWRSPADVIDREYWKEIITSCHQPEVISEQYPFDHSQEVITELVEAGHDITYISDRSPDCKGATREWIEAHFPTPDGTKFLFDRMEVKSPFIADCQYMIDDRPRNLVDFLYDQEWPWFNDDERRAFGLIAEHNRALTDIPGIYLAPNWKLLRQYLAEQGVLGPLVDEKNTYVTGTNQKLVSVHEVSPDCFEFGCSIHNPSEHALSAHPTHWRGDRGLMERICSHGVGHPDPDHINWVRRTRGFEVARTESVHGCDGCCHG